jgi:hypothetical protein
MRRLGSVLLAATLVASVVMSFMGPPKEAEFLWDGKLFFAVYGFVGGVAIIFVSKWIGRYWLQRDEEYYDPHQAPAEAEDGGASVASGEMKRGTNSDEPGLEAGSRGSLEGERARRGRGQDHA